MSRLSTLTRAIRDIPVKRDFLKEAEDAVERSLARESFDPTKPEDMSEDDMQTQIAIYDNELSKLENLNSRVDYIQDNIDDMANEELVNSLNAIEPTFTKGELRLATENYGSQIRTTAKLACESLSGRIKFGLLALLIAAILKVIGWLIKSLMSTSRGIHNFDGRKETSPTKRQVELEEEIIKRADAEAEEAMTQKYATFRAVFEKGLEDMLNFPSPGNRREKGSMENGAAGNLVKRFFIAIDDDETITYDEKPKVLQDCINVVLKLIERDIPMGHFCFNDITTDIVARDIYNYCRSGYQPPLSKFMSSLAVIVPNNIDESHWISTEMILQNKGRLLTQCLPDYLGMVMDKLRNTAGHLEKFLGNSRTRKSEFLEDNELAVAKDFLLTRRVRFNKHEDYLHYIERVGEAFVKIRCNPNMGHVASAPVEFVHGENKRSKDYGEYVVHFNDPDYVYKNVRIDAYQNPVKYLNSLGNVDGVVAWAQQVRWFQGSFKPKDTIESRFWKMARDYELIKDDVADALRVLEKTFEEYDAHIKNLKNARQEWGTKLETDDELVGTIVFNYDIPIQDHLMTIAPKDKRDNPTQAPFMMKLGDHIVGWIGIYREALSGWGAVATILKQYTELAKSIDLKKPERR